MATKPYSRFTINESPADGQKLKRGDDHSCLLIIYGAGLTGSIVRFVAKENISDSDAAAIFNKTATVTVSGNVLTGVWLIDSVETASLPDAGMSLIYGLQIVTGGKVTTLEEGAISVDADIVRTNS